MSVRFINRFSCLIHVDKPTDEVMNYRFLDGIDNWPLSRASGLEGGGTLIDFSSEAHDPESEERIDFIVSIARQLLEKGERLKLYTSTRVFLQSDSPRELTLAFHELSGHFNASSDKNLRRDIVKQGKELPDWLVRECMTKAKLAYQYEIGDIPKENSECLIRNAIKERLAYDKWLKSEITSLAPTAEALPTR